MATRRVGAPSMLAPLELRKEPKSLPTVLGELLRLPAGLSAPLDASRYIGFPAVGLGLCLLLARVAFCRCAAAGRFGLLLVAVEIRGCTVARST